MWSNSRSYDIVGKFQQPRSFSIRMWKSTAGIKSISRNNVALKHIKRQEEQKWHILVIVVSVHIVRDSIRARWLVRTPWCCHLRHSLAITYRSVLIFWDILIDNMSWFCYILLVSYFSLNVCAQFRFENKAINHTYIDFIGFVKPTIQG